MMTFIIFVLLGVIAAVFGSLIGLGGGVIIVPALLVLGPYLLDQPLSVAEAVGTSLMVLIFIGLSSTITLMKQKRVDFRSAWLFFVTSGPAAMTGAAMTGKLDQDLFEMLFGFFMLLMAFLIWIKSRLKPMDINWKYKRSYTDIDGNTFSYGYSVLPALLLGACVGFISGLFGIGGGSLFVPAMILLFQYPPHIATATSMFIVLLSALVGTITKISLNQVDFWSVAAIAPGALFGGWLGAWTAGKLNSQRLMKVLLLAFLLIAMRMIYAGFA